MTFKKWPKKWNNPKYEDNLKIFVYPKNEDGLKKDELKMKTATK